MPSSMPAPRAALALLLTAALALPLLAEEPQPAVPEAEKTLAQQVLDAYRGASTYESQVTLSIRQEQGRWAITKTGAINLAMDREQRAVLLDNPDFRLLIDATQTILTSEQLPNRHVAAESPAEFTFEVLSTQPATQMLFQGPPQPDLLMLTAENPYAVLSGVPEPAITAGTGLGQDGKEYPALTLSRDEGDFVLLIDPQTHLLREMTLTLRLDPIMAAQLPGSPPRFHWAIAAKPINQPLAEGTFRFDAEGSEAFASVQEMVQGRQQPQQQDDMGVPPLKLAALQGDPFDLAQAGDDVIVLDFWATWCGPCVQSLPLIQKFHDWAKEQNKPVRVYAVNVAEAAEDVQAFVNEHNLTLPVLMDSDGAASSAFNVTGIPATFVIHRGRVVNAHVGLKADMEDLLKRDVEQALGEAPQEAPAEPHDHDHDHE